MREHCIALYQANRHTCCVHIYILKLILHKRAFMKRECFISSLKNKCGHSKKPPFHKVEF